MEHDSINLSATERKLCGEKGIPEVDYALLLRERKAEKVRQWREQSEQAYRAIMDTRKDGVPIAYAAASRELEEWETEEEDELRQLITDDLQQWMLAGGIDPFAARLSAVIQEFVPEDRQMEFAKKLTQ